MKNPSPGESPPILSFFMLLSKVLQVNTSITSFHELSALLLSNCGKSSNLSSLEAAITQYGKEYPEPEFYTGILPNILKWASEPVNEHPTILNSTTVSTPRLETRYSTSFARHILSNAFLLNIAKASKFPQVGSLDLLKVYNGARKPELVPVGIAKIMALISYFSQVTGIDDREILIERIHTLTPNWNKTFSSKTVDISTERMENFRARGFVNFANKRLHVFAINPSGRSSFHLIATQEEVLFMSCPESYVAMLFSVEMHDNEVIAIRNVRRYVDYKGYGNDFRFVGAYESPQPIIDVLSIDAVTSDHFSQKNIERDVLKAYTAFASIPSSEAIVTGHWGCGKFKGDKRHKFIQQVAAASAANRYIYYSVFGEDDTAAEFKDLLQMLDNRPLAGIVQDLFESRTISQLLEKVKGRSGK